MSTSTKTVNPKTRRDKSKAQALDEATRMAKALSHPLRSVILSRLNERVASPSELAEELDAPLGTVSYHVRTLLNLDCIELVSTRPRRGAVEHHYRAIRRAWGDDSTWDLLPPNARRGFAAEWFKMAFGDAREALDAGGFDERSDCNMYFSRFDLDEQAWRQLSERMNELLEYAVQLQAESAGRSLDGEQDGKVKTGVILAQYESKDGAPR
ncbi:MAG TPA: helix-turn-helix domain-containing protein [Thermoleophilaceae bacterium]|nr:helix-turn-helix domain-containing protein [Thermoleophilaceae bacterium]